jgi:hypothetical protein
MDRGDREVQHMSEAIMLEGTSLLIIRTDLPAAQ